ncbi:MAG: HEAT repeat domain-containing protein [Elusimicrobia bacterium]|nr:HEAT repeat domain-containing protein [Elusimicrobiota bacterium]
MKTTFKIFLSLTSVLFISSTRLNAEEHSIGYLDRLEAGQACSNIRKLAGSGNPSDLERIAESILSTNEAIKSCAIQAIREQKGPYAVDKLLDNIDDYVRDQKHKGAYEENLKKKLKAIDSIWALGEIGDPIVMSSLLNFYDESDETVRMNIIISIGKFKTKGARNILEILIKSSNETVVIKSMAFEMLDEMKGSPENLIMAQPSPSSIRSGDLIYSGGLTGAPLIITGELPVGHAGIFAGTEIENGKITPVIADCVPNWFKPYGGVRKIIKWKHFLHNYKYPFYGNRTLKMPPDEKQRQDIVQIALQMAAAGFKYTEKHLQQKGPELYDCVGFTEAVYERAGMNPTPNEKESGWGWPLTVAEQFESTVSNSLIPPTTIPMPEILLAEPNPAKEYMKPFEFNETGFTFPSQAVVSPERMFE